MSRIRAGDEAAQQAFVKQHHLRLLRTCTHFLGYQDPDCEDLVQETFLQAFQHLDQWQPQREVYSWLNKICVNLVFKAMRHRRREQLMAAESLESAALAQALQQQARLEQADDKRRALDLIRQALQQLGAQCRQIVGLRDVDGRSYADISLTLRLAPGTVFSRLARCRQALRDLVLKRQPGGEHG